MSPELWTSLASVLVAVIAAAAAIASQRAASNAAVKNTATTSRVDIEKEAFERARTYYAGALDRQDSEISRQDREITGLHAEVDELKKQVRALEHDLALSEEHVRTLSAVIAKHGDS